MTAGDFLARLVRLLVAAGIPHMVAGSFASTFHGVARATQDLDLVIDPTGAAFEAFLASLDPHVYYVDLDTARDATAEDSIISKLEWAQLSDSTRQLRDVAGIVATRACALDLDYIERWVKSLGLEAEWARARADDTT